jgi:CBS domain-containing protein
MGATRKPLRVPVESGEETRGRLFVLAAVPPDEHAGYLETVSSIAAVLRGEGTVDAILEAGTPERIASLPAIRNAPRIQRLSVVDVMDPAAQRVYPDMALPEASRVLIRGRHPALPVVNKRDEIVGMISEKDLIKAFLPGYLRISGGPGGEDSGERKSADKTLVRDVMSKAVLCLPIEASINEAASIIVNKNVDPLPLTREGKWVGLISRRSLIRKLLQF